MATPHTHTPESSYTNPDVRFERSDIESDSVTYYSLAFVVVLVLCFGLTLIAIPFFLGVFEEKKREVLPEMAAPPLEEVEPRLEAIEDLEGKREGGRPRFKWLPPRAAEYYEDQKAILTTGNKEKGALSLEAAMNELAGKLPADSKGKTPVTFGTTLPSHGSAGRTTTGGR
jgi:hypothetical protein